MADVLLLPRPMIVTLSNMGIFGAGCVGVALLGSDVLTSAILVSAVLKSVRYLLISETRCSNLESRFEKGIRSLINYLQLYFVVKNTLIFGQHIGSIKLYLLEPRSFDENMGAVLCLIPCIRV